MQDYVTSSDKQASTNSYALTGIRPLSLFVFQSARILSTCHSLSLTPPPGGLGAGVEEEEGMSDFQVPGMTVVMHLLQPTGHASSGVTPYARVDSRLHL